jgi:hypothetical protein
VARDEYQRRASEAPLPLLQRHIVASVAAKNPSCRMIVEVRKIA